MVLGDLRVTLGGDAEYLGLDGLIPSMQCKTKGDKGLQVLSTGTVFLLKKCIAISAHEME